MPTRKDKATKSSEENELQNKPTLFTDIRLLIEDSRRRIASTINTELTMLYWNVGKRISEDVLKRKRAEYGKEVVRSLSRQLTKEYGRGWSRSNINRMIKLFELFPENRIGASAMPELSWTHIRKLITIADPLKRDFYIEMCRQECWSVRTLHERINSMLFERTAIAKKPDNQIRKAIVQAQECGEMEVDMILRTPYLLDFLKLDEDYYEHDLEKEILREMQRFLLELGTGFTFIESQKKMRIDNKVYSLDLLFYNRKLKRLVCIELKVDECKPSYKGQMELYLRWLNKNERQVGENAPIGIILCVGKKENEEQVELLEFDESGIHVAEYLTELPSKKELEEQLRMAIQRSRNLFENQ